MLKFLLTILILMFSISRSAHPSDTDAQHIFIVQRDVKNILNNYHILASFEQFDLISINKIDRKRMFIDRQQINNNITVIEVTNAWKRIYGNNFISRKRAIEFLVNYIKPTQKLKEKNDSYKIQYQKEVNQILNKINKDTIQGFLLTLSSFIDRSYDTAYGVEAANWIKSQINNIVEGSGRKDITIFTIETQGTDDDGNPIKQPSIVVKIGSSQEPGIVIGAHFDTYKKYDVKTAEKECKDIIDPKYRQLCFDIISGDKPGADDDGSGSSIVFETGCTIINSHMKFKNPIYLVWYAAEEIGMVGSQSVVEYFQKENIPIKAVMQLDMTGYASNGDPTIWLVNNYVDASLTAYLADLIREYVKEPINYTYSSGPSSDHVSWNVNDIPVAFPFETEQRRLGMGYRYTHSPWDTLDKLSLIHMLDFAKLSIAFAVELAEPY